MKKLMVAMALAATSAMVAPAQASPCLGIVTASPQMTARTGRYSATQIADINVYVLFGPELIDTGDHVVEVRFYTPTASLYQSISAPVVLDYLGRGPSRHVDGYPQLVTAAPVVSATHKGLKTMAARVTLPVAGTPILNNSLYGTWTAVAFVDGQPEACGPKGAFVIEQ